MIEKIGECFSENKNRYIVYSAIAIGAILAFLSRNSFISLTILPLLLVIELIIRFYYSEKEASKAKATREETEEIRLIAENLRRGDQSKLKLLSRYIINSKFKENRNFANKLLQDISNEYTKKYDLNFGSHEFNIESLKSVSLDNFEKVLKSRILDDTIPLQSTAQHIASVNAIFGQSFTLAKFKDLRQWLLNEEYKIFYPTDKDDEKNPVD